MAVITPTAPAYYTANMQPSYQRMIAGVAITAGLFVYEDPANPGTVKLADATTSATTAKVLGMAMDTAPLGGPVEVCTGGEVSVAATPFSPGTVMVLASSANAGSMADHADLVAATTWYASVCALATANNRARILPVASGTINP